MLAPQWYGALPILAACDAGKAVYCGVALNIDMDEARRIKNRVEEAGVAFMAELPKRHAPATLRLKELLATRLGPPRLLFCHLRLPVDYDEPATDTTRRMPLHALVELVDWCRFIVGREPTHASGVAHPSRGGPYKNDYEVFSLHFPPIGDSCGPVTAQISCGHYLPGAWPEAVAFRPPAALQIACENGVAFVDLPSSITWFDTAGRHFESLEHERPVGEQLFGQFYRAVTSLVRRTSDLDDAYRSMSIVLAGRESQKNRGVKIEF
jgi:predicted dehydrogenase